MIYRVHVAIDRGAHDDWRAWMIETHIPEVLATGCFVDTRMSRDSEHDTQDALAYQFEYLASSEAELERYQAEFAPALKQDHAQRYAGKVEAWRELLPVVCVLAP